MARPALGDDPLAASITGLVEVAEHRPPTGTARISVTGPGQAPAGTIDLDLAGTRPELDRNPHGELLLRGSASRPATEIGRPGPPLVNPTIVLRWRALLVPVD